MFEKNWKFIAVFVLILWVGIFLRAEHFHDWARFNSDQARDAGIIDKMVSGEEIPLLGPHAGGTNFLLGPAFYYLQFAGAKIFGNQPDAIAYPTLILAILSIPLFYLLLRKLFSKNISLVVAGLYSVSFFAIKYSRFAWNPNDVPFFIFLFLYSLSGAFGLYPKRQKLWSVIAGISGGIALQLHGLLLVLIPVMIAFLVLRAAMEKRKFLLSVVLLGAMVILVNLPQIFSEIKTNGGNTKEFIMGISSKTGTQKSFFAKLSKVSECYLQGNGFVIAANGNSDNCGIFEKSRSAGWPFFLLRLAALVVFLVGGFIFAIQAWQRERESRRKTFLELFIFSATFSFLLFFPFAADVSMRYFLVIIFVPFVFAGFWIEKIISVQRQAGIALVILAVGSASFLNIKAYQQTFSAGNGESSVGSDFFGGIRLGDAEGGAKYIINEAHKNSADERRVYIADFGYVKSLSYLVEKNSDLKVTVLKKWPPKEKVPFFFMKHTGSFEEIMAENFSGFTVDGHETFERYTVFKAFPK